MNQNKNLGDHGVPSNYTDNKAILIAFGLFLGIAAILTGLFAGGLWLYDYLTTG